MGVFVVLVLQVPGLGANGHFRGTLLTVRTKNRPSQMRPSGDGRRTGGVAIAAFVLVRASPVRKFRNFDMPSIVTTGEHQIRPW